MQIVTVDKNNPDKDVISRAAKIIKDGGLVIYPTDTAYAVGADLTNIDALHKLDSAKMRPDEKNYTAIVTDIGMAERFCHLASSEIKIVNKFMPGPLTLAVIKKDNVPDKIHKTYFTFRIPDCVIAKEIARASDTAITATSANISGEKTAYSIDNISPALKEKVDLILDAGVLEMKKVSTICKVSENKVIILREGAVSEKDIADAI